MCNTEKNFGFSLLELLLSIAIGAIILAGVYKIYFSTQHMYFLFLENSRLQENIRFAENVLLGNISMAGYSGCAHIQNLDFSNSTSQEFSLATSIHGFSYPNVPAYLAGQVAPDTDVIVVQMADTDETNVIGTGFKAGDKKVSVKQNPATKDDRILLISDCHKGDLFIADNYTGNDITVNKATPIMHSYDPGISKVARFTEIAFFISSTSRKDENGKPIYALYETINSGNKQELVENINSMKIKYGVDAQNKGVVENYYSADEITSDAGWEKVLSAIITLKNDFKVTKMQDFSTYIKLRER
jgi:type IV pilus assembly protein PilW